MKTIDYGLDSMRIFLDGIMFSMQRDGGISRMYREVLPRITEMAPDITYRLYLRHRVKAASLPAAQHIQYLYEGMGYPWQWVYDIVRAQAERLSRAYLRDKPDIFQTTYFTIPNSLHTPHVVTVHDMMDEIYAEFMQKESRWELVKLKARCIRSADLIFSVSQCTTRDILRFHDLDPGKIVTVYHGVGRQFQVITDGDARQQFRRRYALRRPFFLYVGMRAGQKNFIRLLQAYSESPVRHDFDLVVVGGDKQFVPAEQMLIAEKGLEGCVRHLRRLTDEELALAYNTALAFVYPSTYEGFGLPLLEAMACGVPVIASSAASIPEVAGDAALFFHPDDVSGIASTMEQVLQEDTRNRLIANGKRRVAQFSWEQTAKTMLEAYRRLV